MTRYSTDICPWLVAKLVEGGEEARQVLRRDPLLPEVRRTEIVAAEKPKSDSICGLTKSGARTAASSRTM